MLGDRSSTRGLEKPEYLNTPDDTRLAYWYPRGSSNELGCMPQENSSCLGGTGCAAVLLVILPRNQGSSLASTSFQAS